MGSDAQPARIVVTRSERQAPALCKQLAARGFEPVAFPVIRFEPLPAPELPTIAAGLTSRDWLVFTSVNSVIFFSQHLALREWPNAQVAAVGSATARKLAALGASVSLVPSQFTGVQLATELGSIANCQILLPRAKGGRPELVARLREGGATVHDVPLYDTLQTSPTGSAYATLSKGVDAVTFTSPSSVRNFFDLTDDLARVSFCKHPRFVTIGPSTSAELSKFNYQPTAQADPYTIEGVLDACRTLFPTNS